MSCYHPLKRWILSTDDNGKTEGFVTSFDVQALQLRGHSKVPIFNDSLFVDWSDPNLIREYQTIPCGQCIGCRLEYSRQWANRMMLELDDHESSCFLTLTYDDDHLVYGSYDLPTLVKSDFQLFMKRLRKHLNPDNDPNGIFVRFYGCGEYGSLSMRPHYHLILFGYDFPDKQLFNRSQTGFPQFISPTLSKLWKNGFHAISPVSWETCAYTARYVTKKATGASADVYSQLGIAPEFALMSRRPGIGRAYYDLHKDEIYAREEIFISTSTGGRKIRPPRYYDRLFDLECQESGSCLMDEIKSKRKEMAENMTSSKLSRTSLSYLELLAVEEEHALERNDKLRRDKVG